MARLSTSLVLLWALLLGPALCLGGLVKHACGCEEGVQVQCQHEDACSDDPCGSIARPQDVAAEADLDLDEVAWIGVDWVPALGLAAQGDFDSPRLPWSNGPHAPPDRPQLPYAECDRPLRI